MREHLTWSRFRITGDTGLADEIKRAAEAPDNHHSLSVALLGSDSVRFAGLSPAPAGFPRRFDAPPGEEPEPVTEQTAFEIGSVTKPLTGMLLAVLAEEGAVALDQPVAELLPGHAFADGAAARVTLAELASHRAGLPRLHPRSVLRTLWANRTVRRGGNPYRGMETEEFLRRATATPLTAERGTFGYSNLGMALLGHALAARTGTPGGYRGLLEERLLTPLGMSGTMACAEERGLPRRPAWPHTRAGRPVRPWLAPGYAPAGVGVWSTAHDLALLLRAVAAGTAPGSAASRPEFEAAGAGRVGLGWFTTAGDGHEFTWHNGAAGGSRSFVGLDRRTGRAVAVLSNTDHDVDGLGTSLLKGV
ncbi:serine hydrolase domain-containing protein [Streptomyces sp. NBC_00239]|uniref:serine hydrolase domain-containing protein n=1 Tax=Streptomyces sp. NBC_00239 TaxID=2903640 RepID=UPI002E2C6DA7|nr:serine hydrolase domain-containing protein [Streptomyces sp. NBC_00239]